MKDVSEQASEILRGLGFVFFTPVTAVGAAMVVLLAASHPPAALGALLCLCTAQGMGVGLGFPKSVRLGPAFLFNPFLLGAWLVLHTGLGATFMTLLLPVAFASLLMERCLDRILSRPQALPVLSLPFTGLGWVIHLLSPAVSEGSQGGLWTALGSIGLAPEAMAGVALFGLILIHSRINALLVLIGWSAGATTAFLLNAEVVPFNSILIALALGTGFVLPSWKSFLIATAAAMLAIPLEIAWSQLSGLPVLTLPFCLITLAGLLALRESRFANDLLSGADLPEERLLEATLDRTRHAHRLPIEIGLPFSGRWTVWQGVDGPWTHQGLHRWAFDFVITDELGRDGFEQSGTLDDFYCWQAPVLSPCAGRVVKTLADLPDNPIDQPDEANNWGNLVILQTEKGWFVELSHLAQHSIRVREGEWVEAGQVIGRCGNSGYSFHPHLHLQVQATAAIGAPTLAFSLRDVVVGGKRIEGSWVPEAGEILAPKPRRIEAGLRWESWISAQRHGAWWQWPLRQLAGLVRPSSLILCERYEQIDTRTILCRIETAAGRELTTRRIETDGTRATCSSTGIFRRTLHRQTEPRGYRGSKAPSSQAWTKASA
ncbi:MAG: urea transporter [Planctomycetota bacterium]|jgi:murein DD-endopeptidase MepM/ murein hydrolase activator NlpD